MEDIDTSKPWGVWDLANRLRGTFLRKEEAEEFSGAHKGGEIGWAIDETRHYFQQ